MENGDALNIFFAGYSRLATPLLMPPISVFLRDVWIRTQNAAVATRYILSHPSPTYLPNFNLATHLQHSHPSQIN
jgi:hypothetical protein